MHDASKNGTAATASTPGTLTPGGGVPALRHVDRPSADQQRGAGRVMRSILSLLGGAAAGTLIALIVIRLFGPGALAHHRFHQSDLEARVIWLGLLIGTALLVIAAHEGGHALGGGMGGMRLIAFVVGPLQLMRTGGRLRVTLNRGLGRAGGLVLCVPARWSGAPGFRRAFRRCVAAGPLASLMVGGAATAAAMHLTSAPPWTSALFAGGLMSLAIGVGALIPLRMPGGFFSDGAQLLRFRESNARTGSPGAPLAPLSALMLLAQTQRPSAWDADLVAEVAGAASDADFAITARSFLYYRALDRGAVADAREALQDAIERAAHLTTANADRTRRLLAVEAAIFESAWRRDAGAARGWLKAAAQGASLRRSASVDPHGQLVATAAIAVVEGSRAEASHLLSRAESVARRNLYPGLALCRLATTERLVANLA